MVPTHVTEGRNRVDKLTHLQWSLYLLLCEFDPECEAVIDDFTIPNLLDLIGATADAIAEEICSDR